MERFLADFVESLYSGDTFDDLQLVAFFELVGKDFANTQVAIDFGHMIA